MFLVFTGRNHLTAMVELPSVIGEETTVAETVSFIYSFLVMTHSFAIFKKNYNNMIHSRKVIIFSSIIKQ